MTRTHSLPRIVVAVAAITLAAGCSSGSDPGPSSSGPASLPSVPAPPSATASPTPAPHPLVTGADVAVLERLQSPTTGEVWHEPFEIDNLGLFSYSDDPADDDYRYLEIGTRGSAQIVMVLGNYFEYFTNGYAPHAVIEWDGVNALMVDCPSARGSDACLGYSSEWNGPFTSVDSSIHYDTLTFPERVSPAPGWELQTAPLAHLAYVSALDAYGDGNSFPMIATTADERAFVGRNGITVPLADLGDSRLVEYRQAGSVAGLTDSRFAIETPYRGVIPSRSSFSAPYYGQGAVTWDDDADTFTHPDLWAAGDVDYPVRSASLACFGPDETLADAFDPAAWTQAGTHRLGFDVYLPAEGGNDLARTVYETMRDRSWGEDIDPALAYPYETFDEFLDARSVFAWQRGDGQWVIAMDGFAGQRVYECA